MLLDELLNEAATAPLYHGTTWAAANEILRDGGFAGLTGQSVDGRPIRGLSTTRSPRLSHMDYDPHSKAAYGSEQIHAFNVLFVIDQNAVRQHYRLHPIDFFKGEEAGLSMLNKKTHFHDRRAESEEFIEIPRGKNGRNTVVPLRGIVTKIIFYPYSFGDPDDEPSHDDYLYFCKRALAYSIPVVRSGQDYDYGAKSREWRADDRASLVTHADKNDVKLRDGILDIAKLKPLMDRYRDAGQPKADAAFADLFTPGEHSNLWQVWLRLNNRPPMAVTKPMNGPTGRALFKALSTVDPVTKTGYHKIMPAPAPAKPAKHNGGIRKRH